METRHYWEENGHAVKYDNYNSNDDYGRVPVEPLHFAPPSEDEAEYPPGAYLKKGKVSRQDPMSHRIIEKRRRDRMNNCLADLSRLIPPEYLKKGRGRVEKTEIIEMAIRHLKYLQDRVKDAERQAAEDHFRAGYQEAVAEVVRFLIEVQGFAPGDGLCVQLGSHLQRHCENVTKGPMLPCEKRSHGSSSETTSSSSSSHSYPMKGVIQPPPVFPAESYEIERPNEPTYMECDRVPAQHVQAPAEGEAGAPEPRVKREPTLRKVRKPDHVDDYLHSYKFKNSIERRFSRSQDEAVESAARSARSFPKRRRAGKPPPPASTSASASTEDTRDASPQPIPAISSGENEDRSPCDIDTSSESPHHHQYEKPLPPAQYVPVFALNAIGKYYVPLSVEYSCLARQLPWAALEARPPAAALHPVTIHVNFQPYLRLVKREPPPDWRPL